MCTNFLSFTPQHHYGPNDGRRRRRSWRTSRLSSRTMVLGDAPLHTMVDHSNSPHKCSRTMSNRYALPTLLQLSSRLCQVSVLAPPHNLPILRAAVFRSRLPCLLPYEILAVIGRVIGSITGAFLVVITLCYDVLDMPLSSSVHAFPWTPFILYTRLHMVETQPRYTFEFPGTACLHSAVSAMGIDGIHFDRTWHDSQG